MSEGDATANISLTINGKPAEIPRGSTVLDYLKSRGHHERLVVVELNGTILPRTSFGEAFLSAGDKVEIVHFVGGG
jgi:thiamine biosynthesis protein ThiS